MHLDPHHARRWLVLAFLSVAQLLVILDGTIVNVALPSAQADLGFSDDQRQWVITAYALAFGSLLLLGGRLGDYFGRKWAFIIGLLGFAGASALGGAAGSFGVLVAARGLQGVFAALLAPAAMALVSTIFTDPVERGKAFGLFGVVGAGGGAIGLILGGVLTEWLSWRWCLYVNLFIALPAVFGAASLIHNQPHPDRPPLDLAGTVTATGGLFALVFGFSNSATDSWSAPLTIAAFAIAVVLLIANVIIESRVRFPLLPPHVVLNRARGGSFIAIGIVGVAGFVYFLFLTYYLQGTLGLSPIQTGFAFMPLPLLIGPVGMAANVFLLRRVGPRPLITTGLLLGMVAMVIFAQADAQSSFWGLILPGLIVVGVGMGLIFGPGLATATYGVAPTDAGVASATANVVERIGGAVGTALVSSIFATVVASYISSRTDTAQVAADAAVQGYHVAFYIAGGFYLVGAVLVATIMERIRFEEPVELAVA
ncbi:MAG: MFS transporter [Actinobacteria bacterium]|nr:MFS transporter [Actinomycetota bacterium]